MQRDLEQRFHLIWLDQFIETCSWTDMLVNLALHNLTFEGLFLWVMLRQRKHLIIF